MFEDEKHQWGKQMFLDEKVMSCCVFAFSMNHFQRQKIKLTLKSRRDRSGKLETGIDSGAYARAVVGAAALVRPQRATGLESKHSTYGKNCLQHISVKPHHQHEKIQDDCDRIWMIMEDELTTKLLSTGFDVNVIPSLILSFRSDTLVREILP